MTSLAHHFELIDPAQLVLTPDGSIQPVSPSHSFLVGEILDSSDVSSATDHAGARRVLYQAWLHVMSRPPSLSEVQAIQAIALHETGYGQFGFFPHSHNWGAVQCPGTWGASACPAGCIMGKDSMPPPKTGTETVTKPVCFRSYPDDVAGAVDLVRHLTTARPRTKKALATGDADLIAAAMYAERYYTGTSKTAAVNVARYAAGIARRAAEVASGLREAPSVTRYGVTRNGVTPPGGPSDVTPMGTLVPLAALFGVVAARHHFSVGDDPPREELGPPAATGDESAENPLSLPSGTIRDILPTLVTPDDARRYIRETDVQWDRTDADIQATGLDAAFRSSWALDLEGWRRFRDDAINTVGWLNTKATMQQTDRWGTKLVGWRKSLREAGGKLTGPGPVAPGQGAGAAGNASSGWMQLALLIASLFGVGYLVRGFKA